MSSHSTSHSPDIRRQRSLKPGITRVRTGCLTCRRRRKKCDERRPLCLNCEKTNVYCEGFPQAVHWKSRSTLRRSSNARPVSEPTDASIARSQYSAVNDVETRILSSQPCEGYSNDTSGMQASPLKILSLEDETDEFDRELGFLFDYNGAPTSFDDPASREDVPETSENYHGGYRSQPADGAMQRQHLFYSQGQNSPLYFQQQTILSPELPFPIAGVDTPVQRRLFCHFTAVMTSILTTFAADCNPFKTVIIPLALADRTVMKTLLSLAGSHLLKARNWTNPDMDLVREKARLHDAAIQTQSSRIESLRKQDDSTSLQHEAILATSLLLCIYEICEGSGDDLWRMHLSMARHVITLASTPTSSTSADGEILKTELNPFLLEFFVYHDSLATVTVPRSSDTKPHLDSLDGLPVQNSSLVGVQDGLVDFVDRISILRNQAEESNLHPDGNVVCKAMAIWSDLNDWKPNPQWTQPRRLITTFYQRALVIWLFSILNPDGMADEKIQDEVHSICLGMADIKPDDGVMACLLFPLFIVATAAITPQDRETITGHFKRVRAWSSLGNVDLTFQIVKKMWENHDSAIPGSWDWVKQLQDRNLSFMVT